MAKALIVCSSVHHHNTARVAAAIAEPLGALILPVAAATPAVLRAHHLLGLGSGIYYGGVHPDILHWVRSLPAATGEGRRAFVFTTSGLPWLTRFWIRPLTAAVAQAGFTAAGEFHCRGFDTWGPLGLIGGINHGHPDARDLERAAMFGRSLVAAAPPAGSIGGGIPRDCTGQ